MLARIAATVLLVACAAGAGAQSPYRVRDIYPGAQGSEPSEIAPASGGVVFAAEDPEHGRELWRSDGTQDGTVLLKDIVPGPESSEPTELTFVGAWTYFRVGRQLWKTDGTAAGTVLVREWPGEPNAFPRLLVRSNSTLFFVATTLAQGMELWKSDGTAAGTVLVANIAPGPASSFIGSLTPFGGGVVFRAQSTGGSGAELWKSDGTAAGTTLVLDIAPGGASSSPFGMTAANGLVFFRATHPASGTEPWVSDGTAAGTRLLKDIAPGTASSTPAGFALRNGIVYFSAFDPTFGRELFRTDGTSAGTAHVADLATGPASAFGGSTSAAGGVTYLSADASGAGDEEPYRTDGTAAGTLRVRDVNPGPDASSPWFLGDLAGRLYFTADDASGDRELWRTDGTEKGTEQAGDVNPFGTSEIDDPLPTVAHLFFAATDGTSGRELWAVDVHGPQVDAGSDQQVDVGDEVTVLGSASLPGGAPLSFEWRDAGGAVLGTSASLTLTLPAGRQVLTLVATDGAHWGSDSVVVTVGQRLELTIIGNDGGQGRVDTDLGDSCVSDGSSDPCHLYYPAGTLLTLTATATDESTFVGWSGACAGDGTCQVTMDGPQSVEAIFLGPASLYLTVDGTMGGEGTVRVEPPDALCAMEGGAQAACLYYFVRGTTVQLTPLPAAGSVFGGWGGAHCTGVGPCTLLMEEFPEVSASFVGQRSLRVEVGGTGGGQGAVSIAPPGASCAMTAPDASAQCSYFYAQDETVTLVPAAAAGSGFAGWTGACSGTGPCTVGVTGHQVVGAIFQGPRRLTVNVSGAEDAQGSVMVNPPGSECAMAAPGVGTECVLSYPQGDVVTLTASPTTGSGFAGWTGACVGTGTCSVTMSGHQLVGAIFLPTQQLRITVSGPTNGMGSVTLDPPGSACAMSAPGATAQCSFPYDLGTVVTVTPSASPGSTFMGWTGNCLGTGACTLTIGVDPEVGAVFDGPHDVLVSVAGQAGGQGSVTMSPPGSTCSMPAPDVPAQCAFPYALGDVVTLTPVAAPGSTFSGWSGQCFGTSPCSITIGPSPVAVTATFTPPRLQVLVKAQIHAIGAVTFEPTGTPCAMPSPGTTVGCTLFFPQGEIVTLAPSAGPGSVFAGWSGACTGTGPCAIAMDTSQIVAAFFDRAPTAPTVALTSPAAGSVFPPLSAITLAAAAFDDDGIVSRVEFLANGVQVGEDLTFPYSVAWTPASSGAYDLTARATDNSGAATLSAPVPIAVNAVPNLVITSPDPADSFVAPAAVTLGASASDPDGTIVRVEFFEGAVSRGFDTTSPYAVAWSNVPAGVHAMTAVATDDRGATVSVPFTVAVSVRVGAQADAYVRDGEPFQNFGDENRLHVRKAAGSNNNRWTYVRFDVAALPSVSAATLRLYGHLVDDVTSPVKALVFPVANTTWNERTITWHNKPATGGTAVASVALDTGTADARWYDWDLTAYVQAEKAAGRNVITLAIKNDVVTPGRAAFRAREANQNRPEVLLTP